jgi:O-methyltransferase involved in polyketide biosynthesis
LGINNFLELSSGFSFRGLDAIGAADVHYIDTDLPGVIAQKTGIIDTIKGDDFQLKGILEILPLNALDEDAFAKTVARFDAGPLAIINEGLLMYLGIEEKEQLCAIIRKTLKERGGYWITADIYIKRLPQATIFRFDDEFQAFLDEQHVEDKMFDSFEAAEAFFNKCGFEIDREAEVGYSALTAIPYVYKTATEEQLTELGETGKLHATWRLKVAEG